jgi:hypothetical protein
MTRRLLRIAGTTDGRLVLEAALLLLFVRVALHVWRFPRLLRCLNRRSVAAACGVDRIAWAVKAAGRRLPGTTCLAEALVAHSMLQSHGHASELRLGVRERGAVASPLDAHAWVESNGVVVIGTVDRLEDYAVLS